MKPPIARLLCLLLLPPLSGCGSVTLAGAAGFDAGTFGVPRVKTGVGSHIEAIRYVRDGHSDVGLGAAFELAGHATGNDADPLFFTTLEFRYRRAFGVTIAPNQPYWEIGSGVGIPWSAGIRGAAVPLQAEIGLERRVGSVRASVAARERFVGLIGGGLPAWDLLNSLQVVFSVRFGTPDSTNTRGQR